MTQPAAGTLEKRDIAYGTRGVVLQTLADQFRWAQAAVQSGMLPRAYDTPQKVMVVVQSGAELGMPPMQSIYSYAPTGGKPMLMVEPALALVLASGLLAGRSEDFEGEGLARCCRVEIVRRGGLAVSRSYSLEDAKKAGLLGKENWQKYPDRMLMQRALGYCLHDLFPDVLRGQRIAGTTDDEDVPTRDVQITTPRAPRTEGPDPLLAQLEAGGSPATLELAVESPEVAVLKESEHALDESAG